MIRVGEKAEKSKKKGARVDLNKGATVSGALSKKKRKENVLKSSLSVAVRFEQLGVKRNKNQKKKSPTLLVSTDQNSSTCCDNKTSFFKMVNSQQLRAQLMGFPHVPKPIFCLFYWYA